MVSHLFYSQLALLALIWLFVMLHLGWPWRSATPPPASGTPITPKRKRFRRLRSPHRPLSATDNNRCGLLTHIFSVGEVLLSATCPPGVADAMIKAGMPIPEPGMTARTVWCASSSVTSRVSGPPACKGGRR